ncbi:Flagellar M-ring protein [uncultured Gammaproteobacteria bacterium]
MENFIQTMRSLGPAKIGALVAVALGVIGFFFYLTSRISTPSLDLLYSELQTSDAAAIVKKLDELKVPYKLDTTGTKILVPSDQVGKVRMQMAQAGLPAGGSMGYEIFDRQEGFGATSFIQNMNQLRAMEGELARTIGSLAGVHTARVHLVLPKRELFSRDKNAATASVFLKLRPGTQLSREQIAAVQHLIAAAVPHLEPSQISIVDDKGALLARGVGSNTEDYAQQNGEDKKLAFERRTARMIEDLLGRSVGFGKVRAEISADLDFDRVTTSSEIYDPESQVVRSSQTVSEQNNNQDRDPLESVSVGNNVPNTSSNASDTKGAGPISSSRTNRTEETTNYEISKTVKQHVREAGQVRRMSVAVLVDGEYKTTNGQQEYSPRPQEQLDKIAALVRSAAGIDAVRGDSLEVVNMRFAPPEIDTGPEEEKILGLPKQDAFRLAEMLILGIVAILIILLVVRPLINKAFERSVETEEEMDKLLADQSAMQAALPPPTGALAQDLALEAAQADEELEQMIDINRVEGRVRASSLRKVGEIVEKHPEEAVAILRSWMYQET